MLSPLPATPSLLSGHCEWTWSLVFTCSPVLCLLDGGVCETTCGPHAALSAAPAHLLYLNQCSHQRLGPRTLTRTGLASEQTLLSSQQVTVPGHLPVPRGSCGSHAETTEPGSECRPSPGQLSG